MDLAMTKALPADSEVTVAKLRQDIKAYRMSCGFSATYEYEVIWGVKKMRGNCLVWNPKWRLNRMETKPRKRISGKQPVRLQLTLEKFFR